MTGALHHVLLIGPDDDARRALHVMLDRAGKQVAAVADVEAARGVLAPCDAVIAPGELASALIRAVDEAGEPRPPVIAVVRARALAPALDLLALGIDDVIAEPIDELALALALRHAAATPRPAPAVAPPAMIGDGAAMAALRETIARVATTRSTVLVLGESGTGKELVARAVHDASPRRGRRFVAVNCAAIPEALLESELFGHRRGAFTDAVRDKRGLFEDADGGTLFLDEIGELPLALQAKLLRALQDGEVRPVGDTASLQVDVRLIAATLRDLADDVREGRFRDDLYYRLHVLPITVPPLRERADDIPALARCFAARHAQRHQLGEIELTPAAIDALVAQAWPGNVRELENVIERAVVLADRPPDGQPRQIDAPYLTSILSTSLSTSPSTSTPSVRTPPPTAADDAAPLSIKKATRDIEQDLIRKALGQTQGNRTNAAKLLEISHRALLYKMKEYGIS